MTEDRFGMKLPREVRGGTFAPSDIPIIKRALAVYLTILNENYQDHDDINSIAHLLHRLNRIDG
jgi:hypothetical protein